MRKFPNQRKDVTGEGWHNLCADCNDWVKVAEAIRIKGQAKVICPECYGVREWYKHRRFDWLGWAD